MDNRDNRPVGDSSLPAKEPPLRVESGGDTSGLPPQPGQAGFNSFATGNNPPRTGTMPEPPLRPYSEQASHQPPPPPPPPPTAGSRYGNRPPQPSTPQPGGSGYSSPSQPYPARQSSAIALIVSSILIVMALTVGLAIGNLGAGLGYFNLAQALGMPGAVNTGPSGGHASGGLWNLGHGQISEYALRLDEVYGILNDDALHVLSDEELDLATRLAIEDLLAATGDIRARYYTAEEYELYESDSAGDYVGIGVTLTTTPDGRVMVSKVFNNSPANEAGIEPGDILLAIDGDYHDWQVDEAVSTIRRPEGKKVTIEWERDGIKRHTDMNVRTVHRQIVTYGIIDYQGRKVGFIYLEQFTANCAAEVREAVQDLQDQGAECFILDLRENPGGYLYQSIALASLFVRSGVIVGIEERDSYYEEKTMGRFTTDAPLVVMVNGGSASASELVTAAFQDHHRAVVVGEQSYGKGTVQDISMLSFGGAIKYTIAHYLSPDGRVIDGVGVTPDIVVDDGIRANDADIVHRMEQGEDIDFDAEGIDLGYWADYLNRKKPGDAGYSYKIGDDVQLDAALKAIVEML